MYRNKQFGAKCIALLKGLMFVLRASPLMWLQC